MKKNWKFLTSMLLVVSLMLSLSACGGGGKRKKSDKDETKSSTSQTTEATKETEETEETEAPEETTEDVLDDWNEDLEGVWYYTDGSMELHFDGIDTFEFVQYMDGGDIVNTEGDYLFDGEDLDMIDTEGMDLQGWMGDDGYLHFAHWDSYFVPGGLTPEPDDSTFLTDGWWVRPEGYESEGLSLLNYFTLNSDNTWTAYNEFGSAGDTLGYSFEDGIVSMEFGFDTIELICYDGQLFSAEDNELEFVQVTDSPFKELDGAFDGYWYQYGADEDTLCYEITGDTYSLYEVNDDVNLIESGSFIIESVSPVFDTYQSDGTSYQSPETLRLNLGEKYLVLSQDQRMLFTEDGFDYGVYVREEYLDEDLTDRFRMMNQMMNMDLNAYPDENVVYQLHFNPYCFYISSYLRDEDGGLTDAGLTVYGQWTIDDDGMLILNYEDGTVDSVVAPSVDDSLLYLSSADAEFSIESPW